MKRGAKQLDLEPFKEALLIANTGKDSKGRGYTALGQLNQAAWAGENCGLLIAEIERLRKLLGESKAFAA